MNRADETPKEADRDERVKIDLPFTEAVSGLLQVDPDAPPADGEQEGTEPCPKTWMGKPCKLTAGHFGVCQYDV